MSRHVKKVGFINLPEDRLDIFSSLTRNPEYRAEVVIDFDTSAYSYKLAEILQVPTSSDLALLRRFPCHILVIPNDRPDLKIELADYLGDPPATVLTASEMAARLDLLPPAPEKPAAAEGGFSLPLQVTSFDMPAPRSSMRPTSTPGGTPGHGPAGVEPGRRTVAGFGGGPERAEVETEPQRRLVSGATEFAELLHPEGAAGWSLPEAGVTPLVRYEEADAGANNALTADTSPEAQLNDALATLNLASDKQLLLERLLQIAVGAVRGDSGSIMLLDESGEYLRIAVAEGLSAGVQHTTRQRVGEGVAGGVMLEGKSRILMDRLGNDPRYRTGRERAQIKAALCIPIKVGPRSIGVLNVSSDSRRDAFTGRDLERLERFGGEIAIVLLKAMRLSPATERPLDAILRAPLENLMMLEAPLPQRLQNVAETIGKACRALACRIYLLDGTGKRLLPLGTHATSSLVSAPAPVSVEAGLLGWALKRGTPEALVSDAGDPDRRGLYFLPLGPDARLGLMELEGVPVNARDDHRQFQALLAVAQQLAALLLKERSTKLMERRSRQILQLSDLAVEMQADRSLDDLVDMALATASGLFDADLAIVRLLPEGTLSVSDPELAGAGDPAGLALLDVDEALGNCARQRGKAITGTALDAELAGRLAGLERVRWVVAAPVPGPRGAVALLTLYGISEATFGLEADEVAVLEKFCGHLGRAIARADTRAEEPSAEALLPWGDFRTRVMQRITAAERDQRAFTVTVFEAAGLAEAADVRGRAWLSAARDALHAYLVAQVEPGTLVTRAREGRLALLEPDVDDEWRLRQQLTAGWPEAAAASGVEDLSFVPFEVECFTYLKDSQNPDEFLDMVADRFGDDLSAAAS